VTTLTATSTFLISEGDTVSESAEVVVLPVAGAGQGTGRLVHPTLGTFDYGHAPDRWRNLRGDVVVPPVWASTTTLGGVSNALWPGSVQDVVVEEEWNAGELSLEVEDLDVLNAFWTTPPDPTLGMPNGYVQWWPSYATDLGFYVALLTVRCGEGDGQTFDPLVDQGWVMGPLLLTMRVVARIA
jgi:hypothetical protein